MKYVLRILGVAAIFALVCVALCRYVPAVGAPVEGWAIAHGLVPVDKADWGYLKLRSGPYGLAVLRDLEESAPPQIARVSVAVQMQWRARGSYTDTPDDPVFNSETRYQDLRLPLDGKTLKQDLLTGQHIPNSFWQAQRYRLPCILPRRSDASGECVLRMANLTGDAQPEIIVDAATVGTWEEYVKPALGHRLAIFRADGTEWKIATRLRLCPVDQAGAGDGQIHLFGGSMGMLWVNGHAVNFFDGDCFIRENTVPSPALSLSQARGMAPLLTHIGLLPLSKPVPASLAVALSSRSIVLPWATEPLMTEAWMKPVYQGLPPCFIAHDPKACMALVADIDHDGSDDVIILDREVRRDVSTWRLATLLMVRQGRWTVVASHAACAEEGQKLEDLKVSFNPSVWQPIEFAGRQYLPDEPSDTCTQHFMTM